MAASLLEIEPRLRKVKGCRHLTQLRRVLKARLENNKEQMAA
jgi:hypothetical protein